MRKRPLISLLLLILVIWGPSQITLAQDTTLITTTYLIPGVTESTPVTEIELKGDFYKNQLIDITADFSSKEASIDWAIQIDGPNTLERVSGSNKIGKLTLTTSLEGTYTLRLVNNKSLEPLTVIVTLPSNFSPTEHLELIKEEQTEESKNTLPPPPTPNTPSKIPPTSSTTSNSKGYIPYLIGLLILVGLLLLFLVFIRQPKRVQRRLVAAQKEEEDRAHIVLIEAQEAETVERLKVLTAERIEAQKTETVERLKVQLAERVEAQALLAESPEAKQFCTRCGLLLNYRIVNDSKIYSNNTGEVIQVSTLYTCTNTAHPKRTIVFKRIEDKTFSQVDPPDIPIEPSSTPSNLSGSPEAPKDPLNILLDTLKNFRVDWRIQENIALGKRGSLEGGELGTNTRLANLLKKKDFQVEVEANLPGRMKGDLLIDNKYLIEAKVDLQGKDTFSSLLEKLAVYKNLPYTLIILIYGGARKDLIDRLTRDSNSTFKLIILGKIRNYNSSN